MERKAAPKDEPAPVVFDADPLERSPSEDMDDAEDAEQGRAMRRSSERTKRSRRSSQRRQG